MQNSQYSSIYGIASRDASRAKKDAEIGNIPLHFGSYNGILECDEIDAIYIPLPNHMHFEWTKRSIEAGKHVLVEKPLALKQSDVLELIRLRDEYRVKIGEAFMVHTHPQWIETISKISNGDLGDLKAISGFFSYFKTDPDNIRNIHDYGGGGLWDIGCYTIHTSRWAFGEEPVKVLGLIERDPVLKIDRLASVIMDFPSGQAIFTVSTQLVSHQRMQFFGTKKKLEIDIPFNAPNDRKTSITLSEGDLLGRDLEKVEFEICDQYTIQGDLFSKAILENSEVPVPLENSLKNTAIINAVFKSAESGKWEVPVV
jgi:predicted dehydrogenase